jgi:hypothetical protein
MTAQQPDPGRRRVLKAITVGGVATALVLPSKWTKPVAQSVIVPAHAQASPAKDRERDECPPGMKCAITTEPPSDD